MLKILFCSMKKKYIHTPNFKFKSVEYLNLYFDDNHGLLCRYTVYMNKNYLLYQSMIYCLFYAYNITILFNV